MIHTVKDAAGYLNPSFSLAGIIETLTSHYLLVLTMAILTSLIMISMILEESGFIDFNDKSRSRVYIYVTAMVFTSSLFLSSIILSLLLCNENSFDVDKVKTIKDNEFYFELNLSPNAHVLSDGDYKGLNPMYVKSADDNLNGHPIDDDMARILFSEETHYRVISLYCNSDKAVSYKKRACNLFIKPTNLTLTPIFQVSILNIGRYARVLDQGKQNIGSSVEFEKSS